MAVTSEINDSSWVRRAYSFVNGTYVNPYTTNKERRTTYTTAAVSFTNAAIGGNFALNPPYQFTRWADIRHPPRGGDESNANEGMGSYYADAIERTGQNIHLTFGVPEFNSILSFFFNFYDARTAMLANYGDLGSFFYNAGDILGFVFTLPFQPLILGARWAMNVIDFIKDTGSSKWCYFKPTMHTYWTSVNNIANEIAINLGIIPRIASGAFNDSDAGGGMTPMEIAKQAHQWMPTLFRAEGGIDCMALGREAQRRAIVDREKLIAARERATTEEGVRAATLQVLAESPKDPHPDASTKEVFKRHTQAVTGDPSNPPSSGDGYTSRWKALMQQAQASHEDGSQFITFRIENMRSMSETFSHSTETSNVANQINSKVKSNRDRRFDFADGNFVDGMAGLMNGLKNFAAGALDSIHAGGLMAALGEAYVDIPEVWSDSSASMPDVTLNIPLQSPYGNPFSIFQDIMLPYAHALAGGLNRSAGRSAYTAPFICQWYYPGHTQCRYGMMKSITLTRGTGNVGFNTDGHMLSAELSITLADLSGIVHAPVFNYYQNDSLREKAGNAVMGGLSTALTGNTAWASILSGAAFDEQNTFQDYMAVLGGLDVSDSYYRMKRLKLNLTRQNQSFINNTSLTTWVSFLMDSPPARMVSGLAEETPRFK